MSRTLCTLCVGLILALIVISGEVTTASGQARRGGGSAVSNGAGSGPNRIIRTAQKTRKKGSAKKGSDTEPAGKTATADAPAKPAAADEGGLKFSRDIAPIIVGNCLGCHNEKAMAKNAKLNLTTFEALQKGGAHGEIVVPGKPDESHLYLRLT